MSDLNSYYALVEECLKEIGIQDPDKVKWMPGMWHFSLGSAKITIAVKEDLRIKTNTFTVVSPVTVMPKEKRLEFYEELLRLNYKMGDVALASMGGFVCVFAGRELEGLDKSEVLRTFQRVATSADYLDDYLQNKYNLPQV